MTTKPMPLAEKFAELLRLGAEGATPPDVLAEMSRAIADEQAAQRRQADEQAAAED